MTKQANLSVRLHACYASFYFWRVTIPRFATNADDSVNVLSPLVNPVRSQPDYAFSAAIYNTVISDCFETSNLLYTTPSDLKQELIPTRVI